ncbi:MAG: SLC13 family permease, partial [candidate division WOR-3 bacterium]
MLKLSRYLRPELALDVPEVATQQELFEFVAARLVERGIVADAAVLVSELMKREAQGSTGVGHGVALPHVALDSLRQVVVVLVRLTTTMPWQAIDNEPVRLVVLILGPASDRSTYLKVLAETARSLNQPSVVSSVLRAHTAAEAAEIVARPPHESLFVRNRRLILFAVLVAGMFFLARWLFSRVVLPTTGMYSAPEYARLSEPVWLFRQELTVTLFFAMVLGTLLFWRYRVAIAAASLGVLLVAGVMDLETTVRFMSIPTILFIMAMMVIVRWLQNIGVFRYLVTKAIEQVRGIPWLLLVVLMGFSVLMGGFADEVSAILVTFGLAREVSRRTKTPLIPYLLCLVFATNVGSAITLVGNPIGVYIAFAGGLSFEDFLRWATPVSAVAAVVTAVICLLLYRRQFFGKRYDLDLHDLERSAGNIDFGRLRTGIITFVVVIALVALHRRAELLLGLSDGTALVAVALMVVGFIVFYEQDK